MLYTLPQLAKHCNRHIQLLREYYANGILPDPKHTTINKSRRERRFTLQEMDQVKAFFDSVKRGTIKTVKLRAERRKRIDNALASQKEAGTGSDQHSG